MISSRPAGAWTSIIGPGAMFAKADAKLMALGVSGLTALCVAGRLNVS